jgi:hypothetical protein
MLKAFSLGAGSQRFENVCVGRGAPCLKNNDMEALPGTKNEVRIFVMSKIAVLATPQQPPSSLSEPGAKLWRSILKQYVIRDAGSLAILEQACISRDRATSFAVIIKRDGAMIRGKEAMKEHPLLKLEREERALECRLLQKLGLNLEAKHPGVGRPTGKTIGVTLEHFDHDDDPEAG